MVFNVFIGFDVNVFYWYNFSEASEENNQCNDFTFFDFRGIKTCFLLKGCSDKRPKCTVAASCVSGGTPPDCMPKDTCDMLSEDHIENHMRWRCQGGINPYKEKIPAGIPCYT